MITRRTFIRAGTAAAVLVRTGAHHAAAEPPPEVSQLRLTQSIAICTAPQLVAGELLKSEGFGDVHYADINKPTLGALKEVASGDVDIGITFSGPTIIQIDAGQPVTVLGNVHPGCFELFGTER